MTTLSFDTARCTGNYLGVNGEFGKMLNTHCIDCARRTQTVHGERQSWMSMENVIKTCPYKIKNEP